MKPALARGILLPLLLSLAVSPPPARAQSEAAGRAVLTEKDAYLLLPPELIAAPRVESIAFSPDERFALVKRSAPTVPVDQIQADQLQKMAALHQEPPQETSLVFWDGRTRKSREVWSAPSADLRMENVRWLPSTGTAFVLVRRITFPPPAPTAGDNSGEAPPAEPRHEPGNAPQTGPRDTTPEESRSPRMLLTVLRIAPDTARAQVVAQTETEDYDGLSLDVSPVKPLAVLKETRYTPAEISSPPGNVPVERAMKIEQILHLVDEKGRIGASFALPPDTFPDPIAWDTNGSPVLRFGERIPGEKKLIYKWYAPNPGTAQLRALDQAPILYADGQAKTPEVTPPLQVKASTASAKEGQESQSLGVLWLEYRGKTESRAMVCGDCSEGHLLPGGGPVVYQAQGAAWSLPLMKISRDQRDAMLRQAQRTAAIDRAKQLGVMLVMFADDNNETYPKPEDLSGLAAYAGNRDPSEWLNGFNYTYPGGSLAAIANPSETVLGAVAGPGGRAVLYADGHVYWKNDGEDSARK